MKLILAENIRGLGSTGDEVKVRDSKLGNDSPVLTFTRDEWVAFLDGASKGEFAIREHASV